jgi:hypothetical protein
MSIVLDGSNLTTTGVINSATAQNSTSGTSIDFTGIPAATKRITVMLNGVSTNGTSVVQIQLGTSGGVETTGYVTGSGVVVVGNNITRGTQYTSGFPTSYAGFTADTWRGAMVFTLVSGSTWAGFGNCYNSIDYINMTAGTKTLSGTLDRVRITSVNGTDTFDAGSINILYE